ncbi:MAG TPA: lipopolysaccharide kinase InaA family protein [Gemmataceae bacterium]|nr:lipopolysaccharide kinase InaA family protein [Gemmataceae bacterium]
MTSITFALIFVATIYLVVDRVRPRRNKGFLEISPRYRTFFRQLGLTEAAHFLAHSSETSYIVSGHPDRNVARVTFTTDGEQWCAFLKRENHVRWRTRVSNALAGFGLLSRSLREARSLQVLEREGLPGPEWLAAGEDGRGQAFLLVREAPGIELRAVLAAEKDRRQRRRIARQLGATLARLHTAGFHHPDLYANHLIIDPANASIRLLDWQRACLRRTLSWRERRRGLASLHATIDDSLAAPEERLLCLRSYWRNNAPFGISWRTLVQEVESQTRRLLARRHIREKRQLPAPAQAWICLDGEALCVTPVLQERCGEQVPNYLSHHGEEDAPSPSLQRRWPALPGAARALLVQRNQSQSLAELWSRPRRFTVSPEQRQAALLLRLQRHGIAAPQVLAMGQRRAADGNIASFLLTEPLADTCSLEAWLAYRTRRRVGPDKAERRWSVLRQAGELLRRLHEASCYLDFGSAGCGISVRQMGRQSVVVLGNVENVTSLRRRQPRRAAGDLRWMQQMLLSVDCSRSDLGRFRAGYHQAEGEGRKTGESRPVPFPPTVSRRPFVQPIEQFLPKRDTLFLRLLFGVRHWRQRPDWPRFAGDNWSDRIMDLTVTDRFHAKQGRSTGRWIATGSASTRDQRQRLSVYLKRHYQLPWWRGWLATLCPWRNWSLAWQEWQHLEWAQQRGLPVPRTVAVAEYIGPWGKLRSFLAVEELTGMISLQEAIPLAAVRQDACSFRHWKRGLTAEMARLTRMLHDRRCFHKDLYLCHFFIANEDTRGEPAEGWRGRLHLIDLHRLTHQPLTWRLWQSKDLAELLYSSGIVGVDARDRLAFWRAYRGGGPHRPRCPWLRRLILYRWRRYHHHNSRDRLANQEGPCGT